MIKLDLYRGQFLPWHQKLISEWNLSQYKVLIAGRKARKTTFDVNELCNAAMSDERGLTYPFIAPTRQQGKEIVWDDHAAHIIHYLNEKGVKHEVNKSDLSISFPGYGKFVIDGADNIESLRGKSNWGGIVMDEIQSWRNPRYAWEEVIEPNLSVHQAWAIFSGTPMGEGYLHLLAKKGDHQNIIEGEAFDKEGKKIIPLPQFRTYRYTSFDNPYLSKLWLEQKQADLPVSVFDQEYRARFVKHVGIIYKEFDKAIHVREIEPSASWIHYRSMDFGAANPTVCLWIGVDGVGNIYVYDEYYNSEQHTKYHADVIKAKTKFEPVLTYGDPSGKQEILDYAQEGVFITPANKLFTDDNDWVISGIHKVQALLKGNPKTKITVSPRCVRFIKELESYRWIQTKQEDIVKDIPEKKNDHGPDAFRYFCVSYEPPQLYVDDGTDEQKYNEHTGYSQRS